MPKNIISLEISFSQFAGHAHVMISVNLKSCYICVTQSGLHKLIASFRRRVGHAFRKSTAGAFGPDLAKKLAILVKMEKNVMRSMELVGRERMEVAVRYPPQSTVVAGY